MRTNTQSQVQTSTGNQSRIPQRACSSLCRCRGQRSTSRSLWEIKTLNKLRWGGGWGGSEGGMWGMQQSLNSTTWNSLLLRLLWSWTCPPAQRSGIPVRTAGTRCSAQGHFSREGNLTTVRQLRQNEPLNRRSASDHHTGLRYWSTGLTVVLHPDRTPQTFNNNEPSRNTVILHTHTHTYRKSSCSLTSSSSSSPAWSHLRLHIDYTQQIHTKYYTLFLHQQMTETSRLMGLGYTLFYL